ncbi:uncharacterized protein LOC124160260 [Ischnura elegans]|uniref:uncharacterized protein LOC124160260 n=1 Tax=Ischnura elegans TaxID=197161 RepID=UPI001ED8B1FE|nr:uncharacterized protein LOC124160260 [Ischnura elegans]
MGMVSKLYLKKGVIPHIFSCQKDRERSHIRPQRAATVKRQRISLVADAMEECQEMERVNECLNESLGSTEYPLPLPNTPEDTPGISCGENSKEENCSKNISVQVNTMLKNVRSKGVQCSPRTVSNSTSPLKLPKQPKKAVEDMELSAEASSSSEEEMQAPSDDSYEFGEEDILDSFPLGGVMDVSSAIIKRIKAYPRLYIGLPVDSYTVIEKLCEFTKCKEGEIVLTLKKIRLNEQFEVLGHDFGISKSQASRIFAKILPLIYSYLRGLIIWPSSFDIKMNLPIPFRARYAKVESIIDCFEVEIEKPSNPLSQALTWSEYKKCNTLKYLVSCTPDGLVNFVSKGYGGRASDAAIVEDCGFLEVLPSGVSVMADRGFKHIDGLLTKKGCQLVRPPSVASGEVLNSMQVRETKQIAALRIHVERVISRLREFRYLVPHACISHNAISKTDMVVAVTCGIINCQGRIV